MMLSKEEFLRLQKLAAISLDDSQTEKLWNQLWSIVDFLGKLKDINTSNDSHTYNHTLKTIAWIDTYENYVSLFENAKHEKIANSIVITSVVDN